MLETIRSAVLGHAVGDALGVPAEFIPRTVLARNPITGMQGGGVHNQLPGTWSDDTSMLLCTLANLTETGGDPDDLMARFTDWVWDGRYSARGDVFDLGTTVRHAVINYARGTRALDCGERGEYACGNGSLMRIAPVALWLTAKPDLPPLDAIRMVHDYSACTHANPRCQMACGILCAVISALCRDRSRWAVRQAITRIMGFYREQPDFARVYPNFHRMKCVDRLPLSAVASTGYVIDTLEAALWCLMTTSSYRDCVLKAVNLGDDADTTAAVAGGLAGLMYGVEAIPEEWLAALPKRKKIETLCRDFADSL